MNSLYPGNLPFAIDIERLSLLNNSKEAVLWNGGSLQITLMSINPGESIGVTESTNNNIFYKIVDGIGLFESGSTNTNLDFKRIVCKNAAMAVPTNNFSNLTNIGNRPLKLYSITTIAPATPS